MLGCPSLPRSHQPSDWRFKVCAGARWNSAARGANQGNRKRRFDGLLRGSFTHSPAPDTRAIYTPKILHPTPCALHATRYTPHPTLYILHPTPNTLHPAPCTAPRTLHRTPDTEHTKPYTLHPTPCTLHPAPYTLLPTPCSLHLGQPARIAPRLHRFHAQHIQVHHRRLACRERQSFHYAANCLAMFPASLRDLHALIDFPQDNVRVELESCID